MKRLSVGAACVFAALATALGVAAADEPRPVVLVTTHTLQDTGLLDALLPVFTRKTGLKVKPIVVGSGEALALAAKGQADLLLTHAPEAEAAFMAEGHGLSRRPFAHNDFVIVGPAADPAGARKEKSAAAALAAVARARAAFVSRGDDSGTHKKEKALWKAAGLEPGKPWYVESGVGQAETLRIASHRRAYALTDRGTLLSQKGKLDLAVVHEGDPVLVNRYSVIEIEPKRHARINAAGGAALAGFLLSRDAQELVSRFGVEKYGRPLFVPDALPPAPAR